MFFLTQLISSPYRDSKVNIRYR